MQLPRPDGRPLRLLAIGAHSDDIEIGCGATLLHWLESARGTEVTWVVLAATGARADEARASAATFLAGAGRRDVRVEGFRDGFLPYLGVQVKEFFERLKSEVDPDVILTHRRDDLHQDHRFACELTWNTWRDHLILEYEVPKWDGDLATANTYIHVPDRLARRKVEALMHHFGTQRNRHWFDEETFFGLMRLRGLECNAPERWAEAFCCRKLCL
jgi:LmbE family N-acetylglucosaminyl deacetylase